MGCSPCGREESDTTEWLHFHFSLSCIGEGNGSPLQCSCLENPSDGGAWWATIYGVAQSQTRLKQLSRGSSSTVKPFQVEFYTPLDIRLQIAVKRREAKSKGEKERHTHLNVEFQRITQRDKKAFLSDQCKGIEENNGMGKTSELFKKIRDTKGTFYAKMGSIKDRKVGT